MGALGQTSVSEADGTTRIPAFTMPFSELASERAKRNSIERRGVSMPDWLRRVTEHRLEAFPVSVTSEIVDGVRVDDVTPKNGIAQENKNRLLINLHSGGFVFGSADDTGLLESAPIASVGRIKVITVEYRRAPEHQFPAASEDVAAVYKEVLKKYRPADVGIFGCSAGGILTAEALAWFQTHGIPRPGAAGVFGAGATSATRGDSLHLWWYGMQGKDDSLPLPPHGTHVMDPYFGNSDIKDAMASPVYWPSELAKFPPTLVITSTRDVVASDAIHTHTELVKAGVDTDLHVWDGLGHCFFNYDEDEPESREAYDVIVKFFAKHLGKG
jgi:acetyl esterase/lipase